MWEGAFCMFKASPKTPSSCKCYKFSNTALRILSCFIEFILDPCLWSETVLDKKRRKNTFKYEMQHNISIYLSRLKRFLSKLCRVLMQKLKSTAYHWQRLIPIILNCMHAGTSFYSLRMRYFHLLFQMSYLYSEFSINCFPCQEGSFNIVTIWGNTTAWQSKLLL